MYITIASPHATSGSLDPLPSSAAPSPGLVKYGPPAFATGGWLPWPTSNVMVVDEDLGGVLSSVTVSVTSTAPKMENRWLATLPLAVPSSPKCQSYREIVRLEHHADDPLASNSTTCPHVAGSVVAMNDAKGSRTNLQTPSHSAVASGHTHWPALHPPPDGHLSKHAPQLSAVPSITQSPLQYAFPAGHAQVPFRQVEPPVHWSSQPPQLSFVPSRTQLPFAHTVPPAPHSHQPFAHVSGSVHDPQSWPQLSVPQILKRHGMSHSL